MDNLSGEQLGCLLGHLTNHDKSFKLFAEHPALTLYLG